MFNWAAPTIAVFIFVSLYSIHHQLLQVDKLFIMKLLYVVIIHWVSKMAINLLERTGC